jgi:hypothetical protein
MTGDDLHDLQLLYKEMAGLESIEDIPDQFKESEEALLKEINKMDIAKEYNDKMENYMKVLQDTRNKESRGEIAKGTADKAASYLSSNGGSLSGKDAAEMFDESGNFD